MKPLSGVGTVAASMAAGIIFIHGVLFHSVNKLKKERLMLPKRDRHVAYDREQGLQLSNLHVSM
jgi:hypothetical protein